MPVGELCNREVVVTEKGTSVQEAARLMRSYHTGDLIVVERRGEGNHPLGIVTDRDLVVEVMAADAPAAALTVADLMESRLATATEDEELWDVLKRMRTLGVRRMPVVSDNGALVGLLTLDDTIELLAEALSEMTMLTRQEIAKESRRRPPLAEQ